MLNLVTVDLLKPFSGELAHHQGQVLLVVLKVLVAGVEVEIAVSAVDPHIHHLVGDQLVFLWGLLRELLHIAAVPADVSMGPVSVLNLFVHVRLGSTKDSFDRDRMLIGIVEGNDGVLVLLEDLIDFCLLRELDHARGHHLGDD